ncbi:MAG: hypothetical protein ACYTAS_03880 [Planctomycetota bacterium]|jgi:hypothetical protein
MGNSRPVAQKHYLQVTDGHFKQATQPTAASKAAQNAAQQDAELSRRESHLVRKSAFCDEKRGCARQCEAIMGDTGLERPPLARSKTLISQERGTESGTVDVNKTPEDPDLALIVERWPSLPEHIKEAVLALVRGCQREG